MASIEDVPDNSTTVQTEEPTSDSLVSKNIQKLTKGVKKLIPGVVKEVKFVSKVLDEIESTVSFNCHENPKIALDIEELKQAFREIVIFSGHVIVACRSLARYSSNDRHIKRIKDDLETGSVKKLKCYLDDVVERLARCRQRFDEYNEMFEKLRGQTESVASEHASDIQTKEERKKDLHLVSRGTGIAAGATGSLATLGAAASGVAFTVSALVPPAAIVGVPIGIVSAILGGTFAVGATATAGTAIGFAIAKSLTQKELEILGKATHSIASLQERMNTTRSEMYKLELCVKSAAECVDGSVIECRGGTKQELKGLKHLVTSAVCNSDEELDTIWDIEDKLDELQQEMQKVLKILDDESDTK